jgi:hypothetical protein
MATNARPAARDWTGWGEGVESIWCSLAVSIAATIIAFGLADLAFVWFSQDLTQFRAPRSGQFFQLPTGPIWIQMGLVVLLGAGSLHTDRWYLAIPFGVVLLLMSFPTIAYSGPGVPPAVDLLFVFKCWLIPFAFLVNGALLLEWRRFRSHLLRRMTASTPNPSSPRRRPEGSRR